MKIENILKKTEYFKKRFYDISAEAFAKELGAVVSYQPLGNRPSSIKGFMMVSSRIPVIIVNSDLPESVRTLVLFHECGHLVLNGKDRIHTYHDVGLFTKNNEAENDANYFAAEMMLSDDDVFSKMTEGYTFMTLAQELGVPIELLDLKFRIMRHKGYAVVAPQWQTKTDFLKDIPVPWETDEPC